MNPTKHQVKWVLRRNRATAALRQSGPGVHIKLRDALRNMNQEQREVAKANGWDKGHLYRAKASGMLGVRRG